MSKAEKFISDCTRNCSNELIAVESRVGKEIISYRDWLTPDQAREAVEIAKGEMMEQTLDFLKDRLYETGYIGIMDLCDEYIKSMNDEQKN